MKKRPLSSVLGIILLTAVCAPASMLFAARAANPKANTNQPAGASRPAQASVYKFKEAGIQFTVPAGWEAKAEEGAVKVSPKSGGMAQIAFIALPISKDMSDEDRADLFNTIVEKSKPAGAKLGDYVANETMGGMRVSLRPYEGKNNGHEVQGIYFLLSAEKMVSIVLVIDKAAGEALNTDAENIINSVKKIE
ncbi:MAG TPA: hypothetical protein VJ464_19975 [Blastocatellia bacterium]|nr:hypothetical protein [Blastocatellia bacterium]